MKIEDGWLDLSETESIFIENGKILRGIKISNNGMSHNNALPYKRCYEKGLVSCPGVSAEIFLKGLKTKEYILY